MVVAIVLGMASLLIFLTPSQIAESFAEVKNRDLGMSLFFFFLACWVTVERWRACLSFRADRFQAFHTMGVAHAGNLLIPGRIGEPLRVYLLARLGVAAEFGTSALVQERLADQLLRVIFLGAAIFMTGVTGGGGLTSRLVGVALVTLTVGSVLAFLVKSREKVSSVLGGALGKLPRLEAEKMTSFVRNTLDDLAESWTHPGGKKALFYGLLAWLVFAVHTEFILDSFFPEQSMTLSFILMAFAPTTAPTQPGFFHGLVLAGFVMLGVDKVPALQAAVVLHMIQMVFFTLWGVLSWFAVDWKLKQMSQKKRELAALGSGEDVHQEEATEVTSEVTPIVEETEEGIPEEKTHDHEDQGESS